MCPGMMDKLPHYKPITTGCPKEAYLSMGSSKQPSEEGAIVEARRQFLLNAAAGLTVISWTLSHPRWLLAQAEQPESDRRPSPAKFESGDFIWPGKPGAFVPYNSKAAGMYDEDRVQWEREKDAFINRV